ncbi:MAG TPA: hypothetical protein VK774_00540 [Solirubrobacteraceae bacterium]|jgi:hypothetical protein|nr:hypothetical protein [Solirubrobacteraceae bacterium]
MLNTLLCLSPIVVLAIPLLARRYPGERALLALRSSEPTRWPHPRSLVTPPARCAAPSVARGGQLIARYLAVRPPPALHAVS